MKLGSSADADDDTPLRHISEYRTAVEVFRDMHFLSY
jgi:hypothetical protein